MLSALRHSSLRVVCNLLVVCCSLCAVACPVLFSRFLKFNVRCSVFGVCCYWLRFLRCSLAVVVCCLLLFVVCWWLLCCRSNGRCSLCAVCCLLFAVCCLLFIVC